MRALLVISTLALTGWWRGLYDFASLACGQAYNWRRSDRCRLQRVRNTDGV